MGFARRRLRKNDDTTARRTRSQFTQLAQRVDSVDDHHDRPTDSARIRRPGPVETLVAPALQDHGARGLRSCSSFDPDAPQQVEHFPALALVRIRPRPLLRATFPYCDCSACEQSRSNSPVLTRIWLAYI